MTVVLNYDMRIFLLDPGCEFGEEGWTADSSHVLKTDFIAAILYDLIDYSHEVIHGMNR